MNILKKIIALSAIGIVLTSCADRQARHPITKKTSMISTFILTATLSYLLYNYTLLGVALASIYILATGILNCKYKTNNKLINYTSIIFATLMIIFISINNNLPPLKINMILITELIFFVYYSSSDSFLEIKN